MSFAKLAQLTQFALPHSLQQALLTSDPIPEAFSFVRVRSFALLQAANYRCLAFTCSEINAIRIRNSKLRESQILVSDSAASARSDRCFDSSRKLTASQLLLSLHLISLLILAATSFSFSSNDSFDSVAFADFKLNPESDKLNRGFRFACLLLAEASIRNQPHC